MTSPPTIALSYSQEQSRGRQGHWYQVAFHQIKLMWKHVKAWSQQRGICESITEHPRPQDWLKSRLITLLRVTKLQGSQWWPKISNQFRVELVQTCRWLATFSRVRPCTFIMSSILLGTAPTYQKAIHKIAGVGYVMLHILVSQCMFQHFLLRQSWFINWFWRQLHF